MKRFSHRTKMLISLTASICVLVFSVVLMLELSDAVTDKLGSDITQIILYDNDADASDDTLSEEPADAVLDDASTPAAEHALVKDAQGNSYIAGETLIALEKPMTADELTCLLSALDTTIQEVECLSADTNQGTMYRVSCVHTNSDISELVSELEDLEGVVAAEPNYVLRALEDTTDTAFAADEDTLQTATTTVNDANESKQWEHDTIGVNEAWDLAKCGGSVTIAVIDTGVDYDHPDLASNLLLSYAKNTYTETTGAAAVDDTNGHGTHVTGIIAGVANNSIGIAGISYNANILPIKVSYLSDKNGNPDNSGSDQGCIFTSDVIEAINYVVSLKTSANASTALQNICVINLSVGGDSENTLLASAIQKATDAGILLVAAAGNEAEEGNPTTYPAASEGVCAVAALAQSSSASSGVTRASYSNYGSYVDISAPGSSIYSTYINADYALMSGTSMATPVVSATAALVYSLDTSATPAEVESILTESALDLGTTGRDDYYGAGEVQAYAAVQLAKANQAGQGSSGGEEQVSPTAPSSTQYISLSGTAHIQSKGDVSTTSASSGVLTLGTTGQSKRIESMSLKLGSFDSTELKGSIRYQAHVQGIGWQDWVSDGTRAGTTAQAKRIEAIKIELTDTLAENYDVYYRVHAQSFGWLGWAKNGEAAGSQGLSLRLEAIEVVVLQKGSTPSSYNASTEAFRITWFSASSHVQNVGWLSVSTNSKYQTLTLGTTGQAQRVEAMSISCSSDATGLSGSIRYKSHIQSIGWETTWKVDGAQSGTSGKSLRLEAIIIELTDQLASTYDIYYRVHAQSFGWMGWAKNGEQAGSSGYSKRLEAIQIVLVEKGGAAPGDTTGAFKSK